MRPSKRTDQTPRSLVKLDAIILVCGLIAASYSGVAAYRTVGPYADGPLNVRLYRTQDPETGAQLIYRDFKTADGLTLRYFYDDNSRKLTEVRLLRGDGRDAAFRPAEGASGELQVGSRSLALDAKGLVKSGFSLRGNGVIDAWAYRDAQGRLHKIEVSRQQNGKVDRWEYYAGDQLERVELDEDRDGRVDRWQTYEGGILIRETRDQDGDGQPDGGR